jgi:hypothetical protein
MPSIHRNRKTGAYAAKKGENMVLRTVFLPAGVDQALYNYSVRVKTSKGDLIRQALERFMKVEGVAAR